MTNAHVVMMVERHDGGASAPAACRCSVRGIASAAAVSADGARCLWSVHNIHTCEALTTGTMGPAGLRRGRGRERGPAPASAPQSHLKRWLAAAHVQAVVPRSGRRVERGRRVGVRRRVLFSCVAKKTVMTNAHVMMVERHDGGASTPAACR